MRHTLSLLCLLLLAIAAPAGAQDLIRVGQTVSGQLTESDPADEEGVHYDVYRFNGEAGQWYAITLQSDEFDAYLRVGLRPGPECEDCEEDDDGGGGLDAQVLFHPDEDGRYVIHASSFGPDLGRYTLTLEHAVMDTTMVDTVGWTDSAAVWMTADTVTVDVVAFDTVMWTDSMAYATDTVMIAYGGGPLAPGEVHSGTLDPADRQGEDGVWFDEWEYPGRAGESITVSMDSDDIDALLVLGRVRGGAWQELARDDDGGPGTDAELRWTFQEDGLYTLRATAYHPDSEGSYLLLLQSDMADSPWVTTTTDSVAAPVEPLAYGRTVRGELSEGDANFSGPYFDLYSFSGRAGETVTITLNSDDFDAYLFLAAAGTGDTLASDDDGAEGTDARITVTLPETGEYLVRATSFADDQTGAYTLRLDRS